MLIRKIGKYCCAALFKCLPVKKNRIVFTSFDGMRYGCNPKAMYDYLKSLNEDFEFVWRIDDPSLIDDDVIKVKSLVKYCYYLATSRYAIFNTGAVALNFKRRNSVWINTWHGGGAFKRVAAANQLEVQSEGKRLEKFMKSMANVTDIYCSSSKKFTEIQSESIFMPVEKFVPTGMPRNAALFSAQKTAVMAERARQALKLNAEDFVVLYAPTYRGIGCTQEYNTGFDLESVYKKFCELTGKNVKILFREHIASLHSVRPESDFIIDAYDYPDMQDLLCAADFLITDFSSSIWDYAILKKPCALFTPDLKKYQAERGFYTPIETWPYPFYETNEDFVKNLSLNVDVKKITDYQNMLETYENENACEKLWEICKKKAAELE